MKDLFEKCIERVIKGDSIIIKCKLGLWSVESTNHAQVESEAFHYWQQYYADGEYNNNLHK